MDINEIPVSLDFFKKYTHYEECVDFLLKCKSNGNQEHYERLKNSKEAKEKALIAYYNAFYLKPKIRETYHVRIKPVPKNIKDKLLLIPVPATNTEEEDAKRTEKVDSKENCTNGVITSCDSTGTSSSFIPSTRKRDNGERNNPVSSRFMGGYKSFEEDQLAEDDSEPLCSPDPNMEPNLNNTGTGAIAEKEIVKEAAAQASCIIENKENQEERLIKKDGKKYSKIPIKALEADSKDTVPIAENKKITTNFKYKDLIPYTHCCPIKFKEFCENSNIYELVGEFCKKQKLGPAAQHVVLHRSYLLFYLAPEHRKVKPINQIQLLHYCPPHIRDKFFSFPTKLYLKDQNKLNKIEKKVVFSDENQTTKVPIAGISKTTKNTDITNVQNKATNTSDSFPAKTNNEIQQIIKPAVTFNGNNPITTSITGLEVNAHLKLVDLSKPSKAKKKVVFVDENLTNRVPTVINSTNEINIAGNQQITEKSEKVNGQIKATSSSDSFATKINNEIQQIITPTATLKTYYPITTSINCLEVNAHFKQSTMSTSTFPIKDANINLPVSLDEFKKCTFYEKIIDKLFEIKAQHNKELYTKYKNSPNAFVMTLENYYRAFYLLPSIREILPVTIKPIPNFLKVRLLQIPEGVSVTTLENFKLEQLVAPELNMKVKFKREELLPILESVEQSTDNEAVSKSPMSVATLSNCDMKTIKVESTTNSSHSDPTNLGLGGVKRSNNDMPESPSPKRQKVVPTETDGKKVKKYYKLLPYRHCCPISFSHFKKYTNAVKLFSGFCQNRLKNVKKLPNTLHRAYILYYLAPNVRNLKPFDKLKILDECPMNLREKIFQIPTNLYLKEEPKNLNNEFEVGKEINEQSLAAEVATSSGLQVPKKSAKNLKETIEILENRLLPPTTFQLVAQSSCESSQCSNTSCIFHHVSHLDFIKLSNILSIIPEPHDTTTIQNKFKRFVYDCIKERSCDNKYLLDGALLEKILKYLYICEKCESNLKTDLNLNCTIASTTGSTDERASIGTNETVIEKHAVNSDRVHSTMGIEMGVTQNPVLDNNEQFRMDPSTNRDIEATQNPALDNSATENQMESSANNFLTQLETNKSPQFLRADRIFSKVCQKLLLKLEQKFDKSIDFSGADYNNFVGNNEIPLQQILKGAGENNEDMVRRILNEERLLAALQRYYYQHYTTNINFALKYPCRKKNKNSNETNEFETEVIKSASNENDSNASQTQTSSTQNECSNNLLVNTEKSLNNNTILETAKRIFFRNVQKTNTLYYVLRTSFGFKQLILRSILSLTFKEFMEYTNVYQGQELYNDSHLAQCMYRYVFNTPLVWPINLYITLENLCKFLYEKNIIFDNYSSMLKYISPKLLHWHILLPCTNFLECVAIDYEKRTGKLLDTYDIKSLKEECIEYYNRCWKHEKWLGQIPTVNAEIYKNFVNNRNQGDVTAFEEQEEPEVSIEDEIASNAAASKEMVTIESNEDTIANAEFNCVLLPNTQQQIEMLPAEEKLDNDPLNHSNRQVSSHAHTNKNDEVEIEIFSDSEIESVAELFQSIKPEPIDRKLLSQLFFCENDDGIIECAPCEDEIIELDTSSPLQDTETSLPPWQIDFEKASEYIPCNNLINDVNIRSSESNDTTVFSQQMIPQKELFNAAPLIQFPDVSLESSGEKNTPVLTCSNSLKNEQAVIPLQITTCKDTVALNSKQHELNPNTAKKSQLPSIVRVGPGLRRGTIKTKAPNKSKKNVATVQPLHKLDLVPQLQHNTRPLQTVPAHVAACVSKINQEVQSPANIVSPNSITLTLTPTNSNSTNSSGQSSQNSGFQLQLSSLSTHIFISQELNKNCSVFDDTTLLRITDHNYCCQASNSQETSANTIVGQQPLTNQQSCNQFSNNNSNTNGFTSRSPNEQQDNTNDLNADCASDIQQQQQQTDPKIVTNSLNNNSNDKVNNIALTQTNNISHTLDVITHPSSHYSYQTIRKFFLHRQLIKFHYFKSLTSQHIMEYLLPSLEIGKSYSEALVICENFKTRVSNRSISALFNFWPQNLQRDFLLVLNDLKEFHYVTYERILMKKQEDLRARILFWLLDTAPSFSLCQFIYEANNTEFSRCESIQNTNNPSYERKPFTCLTNAISPKILKKLKEIKLNLNKS